MNKLSVDQLSLRKLQYDLVIYINGFFLQNIFKQFYGKFSIPSSLTNIVNVDSSSGLVKMSASCFHLNKVKFHSAIHHMFLDEVIPYVYVLGSGMLYWILCDCNCTCIVTEDWNLLKLKAIIN